MPKNSTVGKFCHLALGGPVIMPRRVETAAIIGLVHRNDIAGTMYKFYWSY